jgi:23S rRNA (guanosine2251-2'-O)-methyltransferase
MPGRGDRGAGSGPVTNRRSGAGHPGSFAVGGRRPAAEAVRAGQALEILVSLGSKETQGLRELLSEARRAGVPVRRVDPVELERLHVGPNHQGVAAVLRPPSELDERHLLDREFAPDAVVVVLDGITDPQNFGACARAAEAAGADVLVTRERRAAPLTPAAVKASAGALLHLPVARVTNLTRTLRALQDRGFTVAGLDPAGSNLWATSPPERPVALVVGAEGTGMSRLVRQSCDLLLAIPMAGRTASLNAAAALAVGLFAFVLRPEPQ